MVNADRGLGHGVGISEDMVGSGGPPSQHPQIDAARTHERSDKNVGSRYRRSCIQGLKDEACVLDGELLADAWALSQTFCFRVSATGVEVSVAEE